MLLDAGLEPQMTWGFHMNSIPHQVFPDPIKQQQQQKQQAALQRLDCSRNIGNHWQTLLGHAGTVYGIVPWKFLQWNTSLLKHILMTWFQVNLNQ